MKLLIAALFIVSACAQNAKIVLVDPNDAQALSDEYKRYQDAKREWEQTKEAMIAKYVPKELPKSKSFDEPVCKVSLGPNADISDNKYYGRPLAIEVWSDGQSVQSLFDERFSKEPDCKRRPGWESVDFSPDFKLLTPLPTITFGTQGGSVYVPNDGCLGSYAWCTGTWPKITTQ